MRDGLMIVRLFYPGRVLLPMPKTYRFSLDGKPVAVTLEEERWPLSILDHGSTMDWEVDGDLTQPVLSRTDYSVREQHFAVRHNQPGSRLGQVLDFTDLEYTIYRNLSFTLLSLRYEVNDVSDVQPGEFDFWKELLIRFLSHYKLITHDVGVEYPDRILTNIPVPAVALARYSAAELAMDPAERLYRNRSVRFTYPRHDIGELLGRVLHSTWNVEASENILQERLSRDQPIAPGESALLEAYDELRTRKNPKFALLLAFFGIEETVSNFLNARKLDSGVSNNVRGRKSKDVRIGYRIGIELSQAFGGDSTATPIIERAHCVRKKRNRVVHKGEGVSEQEALDAITALDQLLKLLERETGTKGGTKGREPLTNRASLE